MHLLGLGNKVGVKIINTTKTPDKENLNLPHLVISTSLVCLGSDSQTRSSMNSVTEE